jgi:hypothetical protein
MGRFSMGTRKRRRKLTTLMGRFDQRIRDVELRPINLLSSGEIQAAVTIAPPGVTPSTVVSASAPAQFRKVQDAYIYPKKLTGLSEDRVEIYLEADLGAAVGETIEVSGIHGTSTEDIDVDGTFEVKETDTPPWTGRDSYDHDPTNDQLSGVTITNTYSFKPDTVAPPTWSTRKRLQTRRLVDTYEINATTVTLTMNANHKFVAGDIIFVDIFVEDSRAYGVDGLFEIDSVTSNTIVYTLSAGVDTPVSATAPAADVYVFPVAREYLPEGSTWASSNNNKIYYWDGIRWVDYSTVSSPAQDGDPPAPPTSLSVSDVPSVSTTQYIPYSKVTLSWTAPTLTAAGEALTDLLGYRIRWRRSVSEDWREKDVRNPSATSYTFDDDALLEQGTTYYFELYAYDSGLQDSTAATATHTTDQLTGDIDVYPPTNPVATSRLGTITVTWDGNLKTGPATTAPAPEDVVLLKIYVSTSSASFTPSSSNLAKSVRVWGSDGGFDVLTDLTYNTTYYIKITIVNTSGFESDPSGAVSAQVSPLVDADIVNSALSNWPFNGGVVPAGALASGAINASNLFGNDVVVQAAIAANAIGADQIAANSVIAGKIGANAVTAATIASGSISADKIQSNAITADKINAGSITAVKIAADAITADKIEANAVTAAKLESDLTLSNLIKTGPAGSARIEIRGANHPNPGIVSFSDGLGNTAFRFYSNGVSYLDSVEVAGTLSVSGAVSGGTIRTSSGTKRVQLTGSTNSVDFYEAGTRRGYIEGRSSGMVLQGQSTATLTIGASAISADVSFSADGVYSTQRLGQSVWTNTGTGSFTVNRNSGGFLVPTTSDGRLKTDIIQIENALEQVNQLNPVTFKWANDEANPLRVPGLIAQEVSNVFSENEVFLVHRLSDPEAEGDFATDPVRSLEYINLLPYLIKSIQELSEKNTQLEARIATLEGTT